MDNTNIKWREDQNINPAVSALVLLSVIATGFTTYAAYKDDQMVAQYEADQASFEQTASALVGLRIVQLEAVESASTTEATEAKH